MSNEYMDLVIMTNGKVCRAPGFSDIKPGYRVAVQGCTYDVPEVVEAVAVPVSEALLTLPKVCGFIFPLEYDEDKQEENADV